MAASVGCAGCTLARLHTKREAWHLLTFPGHYHMFTRCIDYSPVHINLYIYTGTNILSLVFQGRERFKFHIVCIDYVILEYSPRTFTDSTRVKGKRGHINYRGWWCTDVPSYRGWNFIVAGIWGPIARVVGYIILTRTIRQNSKRKLRLFGTLPVKTTNFEWTYHMNIVWYNSHNANSISQHLHVQHVLVCAITRLQLDCCFFIKNYKTQPNKQQVNDKS